MAAEFPYTPNPANVGKYLDHIQHTGVPTKLTTRHLESVGFRSKNDRRLPAVMKAINFLDTGSVPTENWREYKDGSKSGRILAGELKSTYSDLFSIYPDAYRKDDEALYNYFASKTGLAKNTVEKIVKTFKVLCDKAAFNGSVTPARRPPEEKPPAEEPPPALPAQPAAPSVVINVQLQLPETDNAEIYENLFKAMKKHLYP